MSDQESERSDRPAAKTATAVHDTVLDQSALQALDAKWESRFEALAHMIKQIAGEKRASDGDDPSPVKQVQKDDDGTDADIESDTNGADEQPGCSKVGGQNRPKRKPEPAESDENSADEQQACSQNKGENRPKRKPVEHDKSPVPRKAAKSAVPPSGNESESDEEIVADDAISVPDADTDLLQELDADLEDEEEVGENVAISLAKVINKSFRRKFSETKYNGRFEKYRRPGNCANLQAPMVNSEIWNSISADARKADIKLSQVQKAISKAGAALASSTQTLLRAQRGACPETLALLKSAVKINGDAEAAMGHAFHDLSLKRRQAIRPHLQQCFAALCKDKQPVTQLLFGDNLAQSIRDIRETERLGATVALPSTSKQPKPGASYAYTKSKKSFLAQSQWGQGQRDNFYKKKRGGYNQSRGGKSRPYGQGYNYNNKRQ